MVAGIFYVFGENGKTESGRLTRIAYNWFHDNPAPHPGPGIYLDNYARNYQVDHNVVWNVPNDAGVRINAPSLDCKIYHNTLFATKEIGRFTFLQFPRFNPDPKFWTKKQMYSYDSKNNLYLADHPQAQLSDPARWPMNPPIRTFRPRKRLVTPSATPRRISFPNLRLTPAVLASDSPVNKSKRQNSRPVPAPKATSFSRGVVPYRTPSTKFDKCAARYYGNRRVRKLPADERSSPVFIGVLNRTALSQPYNSDDGVPAAGIDPHLRA